MVLLCSLDFLNLCSDRVIVGGGIDITDYAKGYREAVTIAHQGKLQLQGVVLTVCIVNKDVLQGYAVLAKLITEHGSTLDNETIVHSDQGCHYTSYAFVQKLKDAEFVQSMSRRGNCWDNSPQESFFGHMKDEIADLIAICITFEEVVARIDDWMDYYNNDRGQWDLLKMTPKEYYVYLQTGIYPLPVYQKPISRGSAPDPEV